MSRTIIIIILIILVIISGIELFFLFRDEKKVKNELSQINQKMQSLNEENQNLRAQIDYYSDPANLGKELKAKFNYRRPDEKMMIIVP